MSRRIIDLSLTVTSETKGPPSTDVRVELEPKRRGPGFWQVSHIYESLHTEAHVDSPLHCFADGATIIETPLDKVIGPAALFDLPDIGANQPVTAAALELADLAERGYEAIFPIWATNKTPRIKAEAVANLLQVSGVPEAAMADPNQFIDNSLIDAIAPPG